MEKLETANNTPSYIGIGALFGGGIKISAACADAFNWRRPRAFISAFVFGVVILTMVVTKIAVSYKAIQLTQSIQLPLFCLLTIGTIAFIITAKLIADGPNLSTLETRKVNGEWIVLYSFKGILNTIYRQRRFNTEAEAKAFAGN